MGAGPSAGGTPAFNPATYGTVVGWWKMEGQSYSDNDTVTTIADSSGNGYTLTQGGSGTGTFKTNILNGLPVLRTADNTEYWESAGDIIDDTVAQTFYFVSKQEVNDVSVLLSDDAAVLVIAGFLNSTTLRTWTNGSGNLADITIDDATTGFKLYRVIQRATTGANGTTTVRQAGVDKGTTASRDRGATAKFRLGYNASQSFQGDFAELLIYNGEVTDAAIETYFNTRFGL